MSLVVEDLEDQSKYRQILAISYKDLVPFIFEYLRKRSDLIIFFWSLCFIFLALAIRIRINIAGNFPVSQIFLHSVLGMIALPILCIPFHELLHIIPYVISGAKRIRIGMDLKHYLFYVTAHRHVTKSLQFKIVALVPFILISLIFLYLVFYLPGLWKWSMSLFLLCAGDFALLNFYFLNREKKIYTWDDADEKMAYFYEEIEIH
jgi:hypothetical protein